MNGQKVVPVTAQWALWGGDLRGSGYRVLAHSSGAINEDDFSEVIDRFLPGTLDSLPQVTIGWLPDPAADGYLVTMAIHDQHVLPDTDADRTGAGQVVRTRLFCVPYLQLAAGSVGYQAMYQAFDRFVPPMPDLHPIEAELPATEPTALPGKVHASALRAAALLLTGKPVRIVGADLLSVGERLRFIDSVAFLLPYGLRSRLSASTWVSGTVSRHRLRLFFTTAGGAASDSDHSLVWNERSDRPIEDVIAADYLRVLRDGEVRPTQLGAYKEPIDFSPGDISKVVTALTGLASVDVVLRSCDTALDHDAGRLEANVKLLRRRLADPRTPEQSRRYAHLIKQLRLFRPSPLVSGELLDEFYDVLLRIAFGTPVNYGSYCDIEEAADWQAVGAPPHQALLRAVQRAGLRGPTRLIVPLTMGDDELKRTLSYRDVPSAVVVSSAADTRLLPRHAKMICETIAREVLSQPGNHDRQALRAALSQHGYLAPMLEQRFPDEPATQLSLLGGILRAAYGRSLTSAEAKDVLSTAHGKPTAALLGATLQAVDQRDASEVTGQFPATFVNVPSATDAAPDSVSSRPREGVRPAEPRRTRPPASGRAVTSTLIMVVPLGAAAILGIFLYLIMAK